MRWRSSFVNLHENLAARALQRLAMLRIYSLPDSGGLPAGIPVFWFFCGLGYGLRDKGY
jgi:hypothetical protein